MPRCRALGYGEALLRNDVENYAAAYQNVWSGPHSGVGLYAAAYLKAGYEKICFLHSVVENYAAAYQKVWSQFILF